MRFTVRSVCAHRSFKVYYSVQNKNYTLTQDRLTDSLVLEGRTPYESLPGRVSMTYTSGEKWGVQAFGALSDRSASYPEVLVKWSWASPPRGQMIFVMEYQVSSGVQPDPSQVTVSIQNMHTGRDLDLKVKKIDWRHLDQEQTKVGVMAFAVADPVPGETDAGVVIRVLDATSFTGYRTAFWTAAVRLEEAEVEVMSGERAAHLLQMADVINRTSDLAIGLSASRANSLSSSIDFPDLAVIGDLE